MSGVMLPLFMASGLAGAALAVVSPWRVLRDALALAIPALGTVAGIWLFATTAQHGTIAHSVGLFTGGVAIPFADDCRGVDSGVRLQLVCAGGGRNPGAFLPGADADAVGRRVRRTADGGFV